MANFSEVIEQTNYTLSNPIIKVLLNKFIGRIGDILISIGSPDKLGLDAGCGEAHMLGHLYCRGVIGKLVAVDVNSKYLSFASKSYPYFEFSTSDLTHLPFYDHTFDYIISTEVFEHLHDPSRALMELRRVGKKGAHLIISVPFEPFFHWGNLVRGQYWDRGGYTPDHRNLWHRQNFKKFLTPFVTIEREYGYGTFPWLLYGCRFI